MVIKTYNQSKSTNNGMRVLNIMSRKKKILTGKDKMADFTKSAIAFAGGPAALARHIRAEGHTITTQAISQWLLVPGERVLLVEKAANEKVNRYQMRPDVFGDGQ